MPNDNNISYRNLNKTADLVKNGMDRLYRNTYFTSQRNVNSLEQIKNNIDVSIDKLIDNNFKSVGTSSVAALYNRLQEKNYKMHLGAISELEDLFNDQSLTDAIMNTWASNKYIKEYDNDIDILCKYMPQLETALDIKKDNVLAADYFSKDFIHASSTKKVDDSEFTLRIKKLKEKYDLLTKFEEYTYRTSKYGEEFVYIVPYKKALAKLMNSDSMRGRVTESTNLNNSNLYTVIYESATDKKLHEIVNDTNDKLKIPNVTIEMNKSGILCSAVQSYKEMERIKKSSLMESAAMFDSTIPDDTKLKGLKDTEPGAGEGLITATEKDFKDLPGAVIKKLKRELVKPIYIDDMVMGYYYFEWLGVGDPFADNMVNSYDPMFMSKTMGSGNSINRELNITNQMDEDFALKQLAERISSAIDKNFINNNQDLRKEIYMILKYNDDVKYGNKSTFRITFLPPEDVEHIFFKQNPETHRGVSDLEAAILPATLYTGLYMTNMLGILTRGYDKRVYYVKQSIDSNVSKTLLNAINQIKKSNFGSREMTSIKHILNITGRYNDYIIPVNASGEAPINFEIMQGQNIDLKTPLMEEYERMAINSTGIPFEMVQIRENSVDYAVQLSMVNSKFIRHIFKAQGRLNEYFSRIMTKLYNYEYDENDEITVKLPPPSYLNLMQTTSMLDNNDAFTTKIVEVMLPNEEDELKLIVKKNLTRELMATFIDYAMVEKVIELSKMEYQEKTVESNNNQEQ